MAPHTDYGGQTTSTGILPRRDDRAADDVRAGHGDFQALFAITLEVKAGEIVT